MRQRNRITITIETSNDAFADCEHGEVARILRTEAREIAAGRLGSGALADINGNTVGRIEVERIDGNGGSE